MEEDGYLTIAAQCEGLYKEKGSKFLSFAIPVVSEQEIADHINDLKKSHYNARHHCYAYMLGKDKNDYRANDDGEPKHSAGDPILGQIRSHDLSDILIVVVRYFGGTKLGIGGLVNAYRCATKDVLSRCKIIKKYDTVIVIVEYEYLFTNEIQGIVKIHELKIKHQEFNLKCRYTLEIRSGKLDEVVRQLSEYGHVQVVI